jgi:hypothetical protein
MDILPVKLSHKDSKMITGISSSLTQNRKEVPNITMEEKVDIKEMIDTRI